MSPIAITCRATLPLPPAEIAAQMLDLARWPEFKGYGPLPGIRAAEYAVRTPEVVGSRIQVTNTDGSRHVEEIVVWQPEQRLQLNFHSFSPPLSRMATGFEEIWEFEPRGAETLVVRTFRMHAKSRFTRPVLWLISFFVRGALARHLRQLRDASR